MMTIRDNIKNHHQSDGPEEPRIYREFDKIRVSIKTMHKVFPKGIKFGYAESLMTAREYCKRVIDSQMDYL